MTRIDRISVFLHIFVCFERPQFRARRVRQLESPRHSFQTVRGACARSLAPVGRARPGLPGRQGPGSRFCAPRPHSRPQSPGIGFSCPTRSATALVDFWPFGRIHGHKRNCTLPSLSVLTPLPVYCTLLLIWAYMKHDHFSALSCCYCTFMYESMINLCNFNLFHLDMIVTYLY